MEDLADKVIVTVAPTGSIPTRQDTPYLPVTAEEVAEETRRSFEAGASLAHLHARDPQTGAPTSNPSVFRDYLDAIKSRCPIITQITTGGGAVTLGLSPSERLQAVIDLKPDSASLNTGSMNFGRKLFPNTPEVMESYAVKMREIGVKPEFEIYDFGMIAQLKHWIIGPGLGDPPYRCSLVLGVMGGAPPTVRNLDAMAAELPDDSSWQVIGIGRHQLTLGAAALALGGGVRVGFEDNIYLKRGVLARSNAELVERAVAMIEALGKSPATVDEARRILGISVDQE